MLGFIFKACQKCPAGAYAKGSQPTGAAYVSTWELPSQPNILLWEPGLQAVSEPCPGCCFPGAPKASDQKIPLSHAHQLHRGALPQLMAAVSLAAVNNQEAETVENSLEPSPKPKHFTCLLLTFASAFRKCWQIQYFYTIGYWGIWSYPWVFSQHQMFSLFLSCFSFLS